MENLEALKSEVSSQIESLSSLKERIEKELSRANAVTPRVGEYWVTSHIKTLDQEQRGKVVRIKREPEKHVYCRYDIEAIEGFTNGYHIQHFDRKASKEEIESSLIAEAERRGFKEGVEVKYIGYGHGPCQDGFHYYEKETGSGVDVLYGAKDGRGGPAIYHAGKWAEIIKDEPIKIGGYTAEYKGELVSFGCKTYGRSDIDRLLGCMSRMDLEKIGIAHHMVSREQIKKILAGFK